VAAFLDRKIGFLDIATLVADTLERMNGLGDLAASGGDALENAAMTDASARRVASSVLDRLSNLHTA
jgi:1-deoxy-D-xylulose-5-phosphate reductoisomerase